MEDGGMIIAGLLIAGVAFIIMVIWQSHNSTKAQPKKAYYDGLLSQLRKDPNNGELKSRVLNAGRDYYATLRPDHCLTIYDEQAISNDINSATIVVLPTQSFNNSQSNIYFGHEKSNYNFNNEIAVNTNYTGKEFFSSFNKIHKLFENSVITQDDFLNKKNALLEELKTKTITESEIDFLSELLPLIENNVLTKEDIERIKHYISKEYAQEMKLKIENDRQAKQMKKVSDNQLIKQYLVTNDTNIKEELINRGFDINEKSLIKMLSNIDLIDIFKKTNNNTAMEELFARGKGQFLY